MHNNLQRKRKTAVTGDKAAVDFEGSFCNIVLEAIDEGLASLGESSKKKFTFIWKRHLG